MCKIGKHGEPVTRCCLSFDLLMIHLILNKTTIDQGTGVN